MILIKDTMGDNLQLIKGIYIWIDAYNKLRSKTKVIHIDKSFKYHGIEFIKNFPVWNYDGSSTGQACGIYSELKLVPKKWYINPFKVSKTTLSPFRYNYLVLCEVYDEMDSPITTNTRHSAAKTFNTEQSKNEEPWFGIEQEYFLFPPDLVNSKALKHIGHYTQQFYYCGNRSLYKAGGGLYDFDSRKVVEEHLEMCLKSGLKISGLNAEVAPFQWEYQIGPCLGIDSGDELWISRWLLERVAEKYKMVVCWHPKPVNGINGSGCHTNYSTKSMRDKDGIENIFIAIEKLKYNHYDHMLIYGKDNNVRMSGEYETSNFNEFKFDIDTPVNRGASVRIGWDTIKNKCGYFEDRRPASNMDPYLVTEAIFKTTVLQ